MQTLLNNLSGDSDLEGSSATSLDNSTSFEQICSYHNSCNRRDCLKCQGYKASSKAHEATYNMANKSDLYLLTLTSPAEHREDKADVIRSLKTQIEQIKHSLKRLLRSVNWKKYVSGGLYGLDATFNENGWHVHLHLVIESKPVNRSEINSQWDKIIGSHCSVDLQKMGDSEKDKFNTSRYCLKPTFSGFDDNLELKATWFDAVGKGRKNDRFGSWRNTATNKRNWRKQERQQEALSEAMQVQVDEQMILVQEQARSEAVDILSVPDSTGWEVEPTSFQRSIEPKPFDEIGARLAKVLEDLRSR